MPVYPVAIWPIVSRTVTVNVFATPAVVAGYPSTANSAATGGVASLDIVP